MKYTCLVFAEGGKDKKFLMALIDQEKFKYHTKEWFFSYDNASGSSPKTILEQCKKSTSGKCFDLVLCFIDLDVLKKEYPKKWQSKKESLENDFADISIIWQEDNAEDEYKKVIGSQCYGKHKINKAAKESIDQFINSSYWKKILNPIKSKEMELKK